MSVGWNSRAAGGAFVAAFLVGVCLLPFGFLGGFRLIQLSPLAVALAEFAEPLGALPFSCSFTHAKYCLHSSVFAYLAQVSARPLFSHFA